MNETVLNKYVVEVSRPAKKLKKGEEAHPQTDGPIDYDLPIFARDAKEALRLASRRIEILYGPGVKASIRGRVENDPS